MNLKFPDKEAPDTSPLPVYGSPPVVETSLGVQFEGLSEFQTLRVASLWERLRAEYPVLEEHDPLQPAFETFGPRSSAINAPGLMLHTKPVQPRFFFISEKGDQLVQFQRDRLAFNWRKREGAEEYPRYESIRAKFEEAFAAIKEWAKEEGLGEPVPNQAEAIYVNFVPLEDANGEKCGLSYFFPWLGGLIGMTEDGLFQFRRRLEDVNGDPVARLNFQLQYGTDEESSRQARLHLHVRGRPNTNTFNEALKMIDAERAIIVRTFAEITSEEAGVIWERKR
ncbi:TIGR04255 family protein [Qipengyuania gaetbuli]|uniref:TIGR04255 family protein n=1 Tax=Qipengyuania gaetbuli TaxID=266952 RepID=UPI001CD50F11|nr:TIGR04255 family protein [Qipengyuania gaetbuli]MCA0910083.1 TIGR04255 family protein [Qipengyuania gaetbuli]